MRLHLEAIRAAGFHIAFVSVSPLDAQDCAALARTCDLVVQRENVGFDFGNWRHALQLIGELQGERLLLVNDSVYGPFAPLDAFIARLEARPADAWGAIESSAYGRHLQSWFLLLTPAAYRSPAFTELLRDPVDSAASKWELVQRYELGLSRRWLDAGLRLAAAYVTEDHGALASRLSFNPCGVLWRELVRGSVPYVKASILRANPTLSAGVGGWRVVCEALDPRAAGAAAQDLADRGARPPTALWTRWRASLTRTNPVDWPEVQMVLRADHRRGAGACSARRSAVAFGVARAAGFALRRALRGRDPGRR